MNRVVDRLLALLLLAIGAICFATAAEPCTWSALGGDGVVLFAGTGLSGPER